MRIHRLTLTHVKGVDAREIVFPDEGVVVVEGRNEAGKTTMIEALDLLFEEKDSSRKRHVLAMRPVGLDVSSAVEAEITTGPYRFVYRKQWFRRPSTVLTVQSPRREEHTGSAAHDRVQQILSETTDPELWRALRLMQATPLSPTDLSGSRALADALDDAAGRIETAGVEGDTLLTAVEGAYREFFTATGRPTGEYREAEVRVERARRDQDEAAASVQEVSDDVRRHAEAVRELSRIEAQLTDGDAAVGVLREEWALAQQMLREAEQVSAGSTAARQAYEMAVERVRSRDASIAEVAALRAAVGEATAEHERLAGEVAPRDDELSAAVERLERRRREQRETRAAASRAESDVALVSDLEDLVAMATRLRRLDEALDRRRIARESARDRRFAGSLPALEDAARDVELARAEWRVGSAGWRLAPERGVLEVRVDGQERVIDGEIEGVLGGPLEIVVPGVARFSLRPPPGAAERAAVVAGAERRLADLLEAAGVTDLAQARAASAAHDEARRDAEEAERAVAALLGDARDGALRERAGSLLDHVAELLIRRGEELGVDGAGDDPVARPAATAGHRQAVAGLVGVSDPAAIEPGTVTDLIAWIAGGHVPDAGGGDTDETGDAGDRVEAGNAPKTPVVALRAAAARARTLERRVDGDLAADEDQVAALRSVVEAGRVAVARAEASAVSARRALDDATARLAIAREHHPDDLLATREAETRAAFTVAADHERSVLAKVERHDPDSLRVRLASAEAAVEKLRRRYEAARDERLSIEARLRHAGEQGRAERLSDTESALARAERALASLRRRAGAARTLYETLTRHRNEVRNAYVEPFGRAVSRLGRVVYGTDFDVEIGSSLEIEARVLGDRRIPYQALSSGAKEQMSILTRLACASLVDPEQGAPVILDDALGYSDPARLQRVCAAFSLVGGGAQIILLTCTPGRYDAIPDAHVIRL